MNIPTTKYLYFDPGREDDLGRDKVLKNEAEYIRENQLKCQKQGHQENNYIQSGQWDMLYPKKPWNLKIFEKCLRLFHGE